MPDDADGERNIVEVPMSDLKAVAAAMRKARVPPDAAGNHYVVVDPTCMDALMKDDGDA